MPDQPNPKMQYFVGTPAEIGADVWLRMCLPFVHAAHAKRANQAELAQLYAGFIGGTLGSMAADFGHELAATIGQHCVKTFAGLSPADARSTVQ